MVMRRTRVRQIDRSRRGAGSGMSGMSGMMDMLEEWNDMVYGPAMDMLEDMMNPWMEQMQTAMTPARRRKRKHRDCDCPDDCGCKSCGCTCCVTDADLLIYMRVGERRVIPLTVENRRRREREVTLDLSEFKAHHGPEAQVDAQILGPTKFTLEACEEEEVLLIVQAMPPKPELAAPFLEAPTRVGLAGGPEEEKSSKTAESKKEAAEAADEANQPIRQRERLPDVEDCVVFYADLRIEGCDMRPLRISVAVLPRDCEAYEIECTCSCC